MTNAGVDDFNLTVLLYPIHHTVANFAVVLAVAVGRLAPASQTAAEPTNRQSVPIRQRHPRRTNPFPTIPGLWFVKGSCSELEWRPLT